MATAGRPRARTRGAKVTPGCIVCGRELEGEDQFLLAHGRRREPHCSEACLRVSLREYRVARAAARLRMGIAGAVAAVALAGVWTWRHHRAPAARSISYSWTETRWDAPAKPEPITFGPAFPPTDADWMFAFDRASWIYPLPGPVRRAPAASDKIFGPESARDLPAVCRKQGACGVALGGELWGEHVYAALEGVVDRVRHDDNGERGGGSVRIAHFGGMVFTQYSHLAAIPRGVVRGAHIAAGEVIGLVGDTGVGGEGPGARPHLHFAFSIRPSSELPETYWDPTPLMSHWPLRVPPHGTVAGLVAATDNMEIPRRHRGR